MTRETFSYVTELCSTSWEKTGSAETSDAERLSSGEVRNRIGNPGGRGRSMRHSRSPLAT